MLRHDWIEVNREPGLSAALALVLLSLPPVRSALTGHEALHAGLLALIVYGAAANQLHLWAHAEAPPRPVRALQRCGLVLAPERHLRHHRAPRTSDYCISTGWLNPLLDGLGCWRALERTITRLTGIRARHGAANG
jgi:ubiquitin-conjugating enzyme E2 variant